MHLHRSILAKKSSTKDNYELHTYLRQSLGHLPTQFRLILLLRQVSIHGILHDVLDHSVGESFVGLQLICVLVASWRSEVFLVAGLIHVGHCAGGPEHE